MNATRTPYNQRGFALLVVLWAVAMLALLGTWLVVDARERTAMATELRLAATLESAADGAVQHAIFEILKGQWTPDGTTRAVHVGGVNVSVILEDEALKLNPNFASAAELQALLQRLSIDQRFAATLAAAIVDWRTPGGTQALASAADGSDRNDRPLGVAFVRLADLATVPGMTPAIVQRLRPQMTFFTGSDSDLVSAGGADAVTAVRVFGIVAVAHGPNRAMFARHIIVRTNARRSGRRYEVLLSERNNAGTEPNLNAERTSVKP